MIAQLTGKLLHTYPTYLILDVGGVGYEVHISLYTFEQIKALESTTLLTVMYVKSETYTLYGFSTVEEKECWLRLVSVNNIGPKIAVTILSSLSPKVLCRTILDQDEKLLTTIKGVGKKAAQRIILELKDKMGKWHELASNDYTAMGEERINQDAILALTKLGLTQKMAEATIAMVRQKNRGDLTLEALIKQALQPV